MYDVTEWLDGHPGGAAKLMLAAGGAIDPYWAMYQQHNVPEVHKILESYRIGNLKGYNAADVQVRVFVAASIAASTCMIMIIPATCQCPPPHNTMLLMSHIKPAQHADPYANEPNRLPALVVRSAKPFNAETPPELLADSLMTPSTLFYVRNHLPVPHLDAATHVVTMYVAAVLQ